MDSRAEKLALARKKLRHHQEKKCVQVQREESFQNIDGAEININPPCAMNENSIHATNNNTMENGDKNQDNINNQENIHVHEIYPNVNVTEILISSKRNLEEQIVQLQTKLNQLEINHNFCSDKEKILHSRINELEATTRNIEAKNLLLTKEVFVKDNAVSELNNSKSTLMGINSNLSEQLEVMKSILAEKETENISLQEKNSLLTNNLDELQLQLAQLTDGTNSSDLNKWTDQEQTEMLTKKVMNLEQQLKLLHKEKEHLNAHYEQYVYELNNQLKAVLSKNNTLTDEVKCLLDREASYVEQIGEMELRIQSFNTEINRQQKDKNVDIDTLQSKLLSCQEELNQTNIKFEELKKNYEDCQNKLNKLNETKEMECDNNVISISQLNADITSDKVALQRATEQNKKMKNDLQNLEEAYIKMSKDKLELTEKVTAEKFLNRELTIKLSEIEQNAKEMYVKLMAKDKEMLRLQDSYRAAEAAEKTLINSSVHDEDNISNPTEEECKSDKVNHDCNIQETIVEADKIMCAMIPKEDALLKLQERFYKIMTEVADLSDEKHRLEHIILQLQNETDTICEYVALYQQQRSLLKLRDEERNSQIKIFQSECDQLRRQVEELNVILTKIANDKEIAPYFADESRSKEINRIMCLLSNIRNNMLIDCKKNSLEFKNFHPCNCCSGRLMDV